MFKSLFRYDDALWPNVMALGYVLFGYGFGFYGLVSDLMVLNVIGVVLVAHSMVIAAYLIHECAHESLFKDRRYNRWYSELLLWVCGSSYSSFEDIKHKHNRHHSDRADIVSFDFRTRLLQYPKTLKLIRLLEWFYIPALEIMMHALVIVLPFVKPSRKQRRGRVVLFIILRGLFFIGLASVSLKVLILYPVAYMLFLTVMRFMDVHQHTYELFETLDQKRGPEAKLRDREFEHHNTYSNLLSERYPWLNLFVLNFCYHNVHHDQQAQPWYRLRRLHEQMYGHDERQVLTLRHLIKSYHRYRVPRILNADPINLDVKHDEGETFIGVDGVSFLTAH
ncbi:fatty acid desaturase [Thiomicrorhabdus sp. ZW0627]|uniref:fatty acid desaturase family protein n=1 Tax=Thiomicrorhabdus sp. ZW0627 TaxID=3039774 RepID=UPI002436B733|nr:fatty acid desaturase [Thiomicrorhabdus sp. ZW0627]MDG6773674.1 fatty acid desaturase [Thiomicrorhabdus sp. ZW0627]